MKIFTNKNIKEFSQCNQETKLEILEALDIIEKEMLEYFKPEKIVITSYSIHYTKLYDPVFAPSAALSSIAEICGTPTPATILVVQKEKFADFLKEQDIPSRENRNNFV